MNRAEYMLSLAGSKALWQLNSPGKSGCLFFLSDDEKFLVKTASKDDCKMLIEMLPEYYKHMEVNGEGGERGGTFPCHLNSDETRKSNATRHAVQPGQPHNTFLRSLRRQTWTHRCRA